MLQIVCYAGVALSSPDSFAVPRLFLGRVAGVTSLNRKFLRAFLGITRTGPSSGPPELKIGLDLGGGVCCAGGSDFLCDVGGLGFSCDGGDEFVLAVIGWCFEWS